MPPEFTAVAVSPWTYIIGVALVYLAQRFNIRLPGPAPAPAPGPVNPSPTPAPSPGPGPSPSPAPAPVLPILPDLSDRPLLNLLLRFLLGQATPEERNAVQVMASRLEEEKQSVPFPTNRA